MQNLKPRPSIYCPDFIAANQSDRADNVLSGTRREQMDHIRQDIRQFRAQHQLDKVIVLWTANTERFAEIIPGFNDTADNLMRSIDADAEEIAPSTLFAVASILEGVSIPSVFDHLTFQVKITNLVIYFSLNSQCAFINGSPQNTFVPGCVQLAEKSNVFIGGDDFKSGQTKIKSVLVDFLVSAGLKPVSIVSYNHLGNNDGKNLSAPQQFRSKEISKSNVVDDMVESNSVLYKPGEKPDHTVVIKYVPYVGQ